MGQSGDYMPTEIEVSVKLDIKLKVIDILKLRLAGVKGQDLINEFKKRMTEPTCVLFNELSKREGVYELNVAPYDAFRIQIQNENGDWIEQEMPYNNGAARILVVID